MMTTAAILLPLAALGGLWRGWSRLRGTTLVAPWWWALLAVPATLLVGFAFSAVCMALTTFMKSWQDFDLVTLGVMPLFLFSATFFPITQFPEGLRWLVEISPLYRGVVLCRELTTGAVSWDSLISVGYLLAMGLLGLVVVSRRLGKLLLH